ncbi:hypothetical protein [Actinomadura sp. 3N407]|uniref:hypothetical protein n=1 Tax=Actinomadura sp. 3N407 TaxID=3457423 RepID=UPI003FCEC4C8
MTPPSALTAMVLSVAALVTGCGAKAQPPPSTSPSRPAIVLPFDSYALSADDDAVVQAAQVVLMRECMATKGHGWTRPPSPTRQPALLAGNARRYGLADPRAAERFGYHVLEEPWRARAQAAETAWSEQLSKAEHSALFGAGGCVEKADSVLWKGVRKRDVSLLFGLESKAVDNSAKDPAVASATAAWSRCMKRSNFTYRTPQAAVQDRRWNLNSPEISRGERTVAIADVRCKEETNLIATRAAAEKRIQTEMIRQHPARFKAIQEANGRYVRNAQAVLGRERS